MYTMGLMAHLPRVSLTCCPGSARIPGFFYDYVILANLWSISGIGKEFMVTVDIVKDIYMGKITMWNDSRLTAINQGRVGS